MPNQELVTIPVPRQHLPAIYAFIGRLETQNQSVLDTEQHSTAEEYTEYNSEDEWTNSRLRRMIVDSRRTSRSIMCILELLASHPDEWISVEQLASSLTHRPDANHMTIAGTLGAFGRRCRNRYGLDNWPFEVRYDRDLRSKVYRMSNTIADRIRPFLSE